MALAFALEREGPSPIPTDHRQRPGRILGPLLRLRPFRPPVPPFYPVPATVLSQPGVQQQDFLVLAHGHMRPIMNDLVKDCVSTDMRNASR